jgi:hypothetical protein
LNISKTGASKGRVKFRSHLRNLAIVLCVIALLAAQAFGAGRSYLCVCAGLPVATQASHCHGPHGAACLATESAAEPHGEEGRADRQDHAVVQNELTLRTVEASPQLIAPTALIAILPICEILLASPVQQVPATVLAGDEGPPPLGVAVARTVVLLI